MREVCKIEITYEYYKQWTGCTNALKTPPPPLSGYFGFKILSLNLDIGVDVIGPETDFTIQKD